MNTFGFRNVGSKSDHDVARFLRGQKAVNNFQSVGNATMWIAPDGGTVLVAFYKGLDVTYWVRNDLSL